MIHHLLRLLFASIIALQLVGCQSPIYEHHIKLPNYTWDRSNKLVYKITLDKAVENAQVWLNIRHATELPYPELLLNVKLSTPQGEKGTRQMRIPTKNAEGKNIGKGMGDLWDIEAPIEENANLQAGNYEIELSHQMADEQVFMLVDIGVEVRAKE